MAMSTERRGEVLALLNSQLEGIFPVLALFPVALIGAFYTYAFVLVFATIVLGAILVRRRELATCFRRDAQKDLFLTAVFITTLFALFFISLRYTSASNVAVLLFLQLLFAYLYFNVLGKDRLTPLHTVGAVFMGIGALVILVPEDLQLNRGDLIALAAAAIGPFGNFYQKRARQRVGSIAILTYRNLVAIPVLFLFAVIFEPVLVPARLVEALPYLVAVGLLVHVLAKILWVEALHRISITKMNAMTALVPISTLFFAYVILHEIPSTRQVIGIVPVLLGGYLITRPLPARAAT